MTALDTPARTSRPDDADPRQPTTLSVVTALARVEARRLVLHPFLWIGVVLGALLLLPTVWPVRFVLPRESVTVQVAALPIATAVLVATHMAITRARRDGVTELVRPAVRGEDVRTLAMLVAVLAPTLVTAGLVALVLATAAALGGVGPVLWAEAATAPALVAGGGALGVLLGRLAPWRLAALFGVVVLAVVQLLLAESGGPGTSSVTELLGPVVIPAGAPHDPAALLQPAGLHLLYLAGGASAAAAAAALVSRTTARRVVVLLVTLGLTVAAGVAQLRPPDEAQIQALLARTSDPVAVGDCTTDGTNATVCTLPGFTGWRAGWVEVVRDVRQPLAERGVQLPPLTVAQRAAPSEVAVEASRWSGPDDDPVERQLESAWDAEYAISDATVLLTSVWPRGTDADDAGELDLALHAARHAVGLPAGFAYVASDDTGSIQSTTTCSPVGQAREAVTMWLAAHADPAATGALRRAVDDQPYPGTDADPIDDGSGFADATASLSLSTGAIAGLSPEWSKPGGHVALQMLELGDDDLLDRLAGDWARWTDPDTSLRELVSELDLAMPPLAADLQEQLGGGPVGDDLAQFFRDTPLPAPELDDTGTAALDEDPITTGTQLGCP